MRTVFLSVFLKLALILMLGACGQPGNLPLVVDQNFAAKGIHYDNQDFRPIRIVTYIDTDQHNPLNVLDYTLKNSGLLFFDIVILSGVYLKVNENGYYLDFSDSLQRLLAQRNKYIQPLQNMGIKVTLGIKSAGNAAFGHLDDDRMYGFCDVLYDVLRTYRLDGFEFFDDADNSAYPNINDYYPGRDGYSDGNEWLARQWRQGGQYFVNVFYILRQLIFRKALEVFPEQEDAARQIRNDPLLFVRESGFARALPQRFFVGEGYGEFTGSSVEITGSFNPFFDRFPAHSALMVTEATDPNVILDVAFGKDHESSGWMPASKYSPLSIDLDGGKERNIYFPVMRNADQWTPGSGGTEVEIGELFARFMNEDFWEFIFFNNLKPIGEAKEDPYFRWVGFDNTLPETIFGTMVDWDTETYGEWNPRYVPLEFIFNELARIIFDDEIVVSGGNHEKDW